VLWLARGGEVPRPHGDSPARSPMILTYLIAADARILDAGSDA